MFQRSSQICVCVCLYTYVYVTLYPNISAQIQTKHQTNKQTTNKQTNKQTNKVKSHMIWTHRNLKNLKNTIAVYRTRSNKGLQNWQNCNLGDPQYAVKIPKGTYVFSKIYLGSQKKNQTKDDLELTQSAQRSINKWTCSEKFAHTIMGGKTV